ncbi:MAG: hypothetical protein HZB25_04995 [Candidatus Eisenbacteria bacterium]|nr:hypothetical protein [Candidatus Eisenbacteria bacterium]
MSHEPTPAGPMKLDQTIPDADLQRARELLEAQTWTFAKTMPWVPHWYSLRKNWARDEEFVWVVETMRRDGCDEIYEGRRYRVMIVGGFKYWTMEAPVGETILVNRKAVRNAVERI